MRGQLPFALLALGACVVTMSAWPQPGPAPVNGRTKSFQSARPQQTPIPIFPLTHPRVVGQTPSVTGSSFYKRRAEWQHIIDSTWGAGLSLSTKLGLFDGYAVAVSNNFDGFLSLGLTWSRWDSLKTAFRSKVTSATSKGGFAGIMSQFAMRLRDGHTWALDTTVMRTPLAPGTPLLILSPFATVEHFGAVLTMLPDSTALVLRAVREHPLGLEPGDIVLGYEGVPWKIQVRELLEAGLPVYSPGIGSSSAEIHAFIRNVGNNWHLFDTIDIVKHSTHEAVHLPVLPLMNLPSDPMMGNEQLEIPGIPFAQNWWDPLPPRGTPLSYGILPGTRIGYIQLVAEYPEAEANQLFHEAITNMWDSDGLIIDMRWNHGGGALFDAAFALMFSKQTYTIYDEYRVSPSMLDLAPYPDKDWFVIPGNAASSYDKPVAVLLGPTCVSMGDITAQRLRYFPGVRFFGQSSSASLGDNRGLAGYAGWWLHYSTSDMCHVSQPGNYLNRHAFPVDDPVWFTPDNVASGIDDVLTRAIRWIGITDVRAVAGGLPAGFDLEQNYPNPFNPTTVVSFQLPVASDVRLVVYDILGREVAVLVHERLKPGSYTVRFDARGLASGVYLCRLTAGNFAQTRKLVLTK